MTGVQTCRSMGMWGECEGAIEPSADICDGIDNDCDGRVDVGCGCVPSPEICQDGIDNDGDGSIDEPACDPRVCSSGTPTWNMIAGGDGRRLWTDVAAWTGREILYWGGRASAVHPSVCGNCSLGPEEGRRYQPHTDTWRPMSTIGAPTARTLGLYQWTGTELFVWGGFNMQVVGGGYSSTPLEDGGLYNPTTDSWRPIPRELDPLRAPQNRIEAVVGWTGTEVVIFGGRNADLSDVGQRVRQGAFYHPGTGRWRLFGSLGPEMTEVQGGWARNRLFVWGTTGTATESNLANVAFVYDDETGWTRLPDAPLTTRTISRVVVQERGMLVYGGRSGSSLEWPNDGAFFDFDAWTWSPVFTGPSNLDGASVPGRSPVTFWTGCDYVFIDAAFASEPPERVYQDYRFNLESNTWTAMPAFRSPINRNPLGWSWCGDRAVGWGSELVHLVFED